jgi:hypothetical protein
MVSHKVTLSVSLTRVRRRKIDETRNINETKVRHLHIRQTAHPVVVSCLPAVMIGSVIASLALALLSTAPVASFHQPLLIAPSASSFNHRHNNNQYSRPTRTSSLQVALKPQDLAAVGYLVRVRKPLGIVLIENENVGGVTVLDVEPGQNGGIAGIRPNDQLLSVNGDVVIGDAFDTVMGLLQTNTNNNDALELRFFRGSVEDLYQLVFETDDIDNVIVEDEEVIMDENYVSPVVVPVDEDDLSGDGSLTAGEVMNAFKKIGSMMGGNDKKDGEKKKSGGFGMFGGMFSGETVQLDGDDANTLK